MLPASKMAEWGALTILQQNYTGENFKNKGITIKSIWKLPWEHTENALRIKNTERKVLNLCKTMDVYDTWALTISLPCPTYQHSMLEALL